MTKSLDVNGENAAAYVESNFIKRRVDVMMWETEYEDPSTGEIYIVFFPYSYLQGGGPPSVRALKNDDRYETFYGKKAEEFIDQNLFFVEEHEKQKVIEYKNRRTKDIYFLDFWVPPGEQYEVKRLRNIEPRSGPGTKDSPLFEQSPEAARRTAEFLKKFYSSNE